MTVFVTGGSGFVGSRVVNELVSLGYEVAALARSDESEKKLKSFGSKVKIIRGDLKDVDVLKKGAAESDGVIHLGFIHDWANFDESSKIDRRAVDAMLSVLEGTNKPFVGTSGLLFLKKGKVVTEEDSTDPSTPSKRSETESTILDYKHKGVRAMSVRLSLVHGKNDKGFTSNLIKIAQEKGVSGYIGDGKNFWPAVNVADAAVLYRLAFEKGKAGRAYHGAAEQGIETKEISSTIGQLVGVPSESVPAEKAYEQFGFLGILWGIDKPTSNKITREELGWEPTHIKLLQDIKENYGTPK